MVSRRPFREILIRVVLIDPPVSDGAWSERHRDKKGTVFGKQWFIKIKRSYFYPSFGIKNNFKGTDISLLFYHTTKSHDMTLIHLNVQSKHLPILILKTKPYFTFLWAQWNCRQFPKEMDSLGLMPLNKHNNFQSLSFTQLYVHCAKNTKQSLIMAY